MFDVINGSNKGLFCEQLSKHINQNKILKYIKKNEDNFL